MSYQIIISNVLRFIPHYQLNHCYSSLIRSSSMTSYRWIIQTLGLTIIYSFVLTIDIGFFIFTQVEVIHYLDVLLSINPFNEHKPNFQHLNLYFTIAARDYWLSNWLMARYSSWIHSFCMIVYHWIDLNPVIQSVVNTGFHLLISVFIRFVDFILII